MSNQPAWMIQMNWSEAAYAQTGEVYARDYGQKGELVPGLRETASNAMRSMIVELEASRPLSEVFNVEVIAQPGTIWDDRGFVGAPGQAAMRMKGTEQVYHPNAETAKNIQDLKWMFQQSTAPTASPVPSPTRTFSNIPQIINSESNQ